MNFWNPIWLLRRAAANKDFLCATTCQACLKSCMFSFRVWVLLNFVKLIFCFLVLCYRMVSACTGRQSRGSVSGHRRGRRFCARWAGAPSTHVSTSWEVASTWSSLTRAWLPSRSWTRSGRRLGWRKLPQVCSELPSMKISSRLSHVVL